ncbi:MAG: hypothetical protein PWQ50_1458 [Methanolobus sp.]|jgi:hypothetical protein|nr:hypothetical protein [Methanolobus sp.]
MQTRSDLPFDWEPDVDSFNINSKRTLSIIRYETKYAYDSIKISEHFKKNILKAGKDFGCIDIQDNESSIHTLFAKMGNRRHTTATFDSNTREYLSRYSFKLKNLIVSTIHVDNFPGKNNNLNLLVFNGGNIKNDLLFSQYRFFLGKSLPQKMTLNESELRRLCFEKFQKNLSDISFNPVKEKEFGNTRKAEYKSDPENILDPNAEKIKELQENKTIIINGFESSIISTHNYLAQNYEINFSVDINGKIELTFPKLKWIDIESEQDMEIYFYDFAKKIYDEIGSKELYEIPPKYELDQAQEKLKAVYESAE